jgi:pyruvate/2-oxoglutarate dehydrogenase complex dihydrolipoamide acyltransferase (E2) component
MADPEEVTKGLGDFIRQGLGLFRQGVGTVAQVLRSGDAAVREVDGALTGQSASSVRTPLLPPGSEQQVAEQVASLVRQGKQEATRTGDPRTPGVVARFQEVLRLLFEVPLAGEPGGLSDLMPSPMDMLRMGLRDLRGSMALVRLANGAGTLTDVEEVASFAEDLAGRLQQGAQALSSPPMPEPAQQAPAARASVQAKPARGRGARRKQVPSGAERKQRGNPSAAAFARAMAEEMGNPEVKRWAGDLARGRITEDQFIDRWGRKAAEGNHGNPEDLLARAKERAVRNGLSPDDPYLKEL